MEFPVNISGKETVVKITDDEIKYFNEEDERSHLFNDIISLEKKDGDGSVATLSFIQDNPLPDKTLTKECVCMAIEDNVFKQLQTTITSKIQSVCKRPRKMVVFVNPIGGKGQGEKAYRETVAPFLTQAGIELDVVVSQKPGHAKEFAETYDFNSVDGLAIMGGDGTISEIVNVLMKKSQEKAGHDPNNPDVTVEVLKLPIAIIPTGTGNGLANVSHGCKDILTATLHILRGRRTDMHLLGTYNNEELVGYAVTCLSYGLYSDIMYLVDKPYRWLKTLRLTLLPLWYMFIKTHREINVEMTYEYLEGEEPETISEEDKVKHRVKQIKNITNLLAVSYDLDLEDNIDKQSTRKNQFTMMDYQTCGRFRLMKHFSHLRHLTKAHLEDVQDFLKYNTVKAFRVKVTEDDTNDKDINLLYNIDGEIHHLQTPEFYVKLHPRCFNIFSSYNGPTRWW